MSTKTTAIPELTACEKWEKNRFAGYMKNPTSLDGIERLRAQASIMRFIEDAQKLESDAAYLDAAASILEWLRDNACTDKDGFIKASASASQDDLMGLISEYRDALGE